MKTYQPKAKDVKRGWHLVDAKDAVLGRLSTQVAIFLMGKHKPTYSNHMDMGDYVVVINASRIELTGKKPKQKVYRSHSGYPGGFKEVKFEKMIKEQPEKVIEHAVSGMLPDNRLKSDRIRRLKIFAGGEHPYVEKIKDQK
ncbi:50S ribosomal protein L13 [Candidatus Woesebacteria bacterium RIFCSPHIGHO2_01_FULL_39_17]|uniref:Large ribosomal subunit protein uL13 n=4 Tax=Microgenomates group TaxID=1794810 RepID=A0A0H4TVQ4_9BACT|nr:50S ribosomal protein L13, large subunit ribosomal protein L13 [uncultured Microgenomates bacterium Rifle_16ft_4_minimus_954]KKQ51932.1 MAG: 50S ribosomal protein L13 [Microgenomates group bacterium GW2011_GWC1_38_12]KKQ94404.1 MAG: 50S ribosomal protein L13 [Candidatus Woesebacteria bacterium GW2011_GWB1_39_10b]KKR14416.1 MAG: 50S ribosomal protein L13 [Candidatus Woesebacteria bacterium GW2011_GWA1_39_21b]OGM23787.1 MAG: 50S ribosomal protein L13 [Candidatus Woesebacteria bacterium RIFCSPH